MNRQLDRCVQALRIAFGLTATLAGLDKFFNVLADWSTYVSPAAMQMLPVPAATLMHVVGIVELAVGIAILAVAPVIGAYVASAWLLVVAVNLATAGYLDIAVRDVVMSIAALTLAQLLEERRHAVGRASAPGRNRAPVAAPEVA